MDAHGKVEKKQESAAAAQLRIAGLSIAQYAGVSTALAHGIDLDDVLRQERIDFRDWTAAQRGWKERIVDSETHRKAYIRASRAAQDVLRRRIRPLDDDPAAWVGLTRLLREVDSPADYMRGLGLSMADLDQLTRLWRHKATNDKELADRLTSLKATAQPPQTLSFEPVILRPFPWTPGKPKEPPSPEPVRVVPVPRVDALASPPVHAQASYQLAPRPQMPPPPVVPSIAGGNADETLPIGAIAVSQRLPFAGATTKERLEMLMSAGPPSSAPQEVGDETILVASERGAAFAQLIPDLSLLDYADFRAHLVVHGNDHRPTLEHFGVRTDAVRQALQDRFAAYFRSNPAGQERFLELLSKRVEEIKRRAL